MSEHDLVRAASHALRTPLTIARGHAELIQTTHPDDQAAVDAQVILDELAQLAKIADRLLILAAADHPGFLRRTPVDFARLIENTTNRWRTLAERRWSIDVSLEGALLGDEERLEAGLDAVVENAVQVTGAGDSIRVLGRVDGSDAVVEISDTGPGIPARDLVRIFDRFARGDGGGLPPTGSAGLGLAVVKAIVEAHGGTVAVDSKVGTGTTFHLRLPGVRTADRSRLGGAIPPAYD